VIKEMLNNIDALVETRRDNFVLAINTLTQVVVSFI